HYYYYSEFKKLIDSRELRFVIVNDESGVSEEDILADLREGSFHSNASETAFKGLQDAEGKVVYIDCWSYDGYWFKEMYLPLGSKSIMETANEDPLWNGRLSDAYNMLREVIVRLRDEISKYMNMKSMYQEGDTNAAFMYVDTAARQVYTNRGEYGEYSKAEQNLKKLQELGKYVIIRPELNDFDTNLKDINALSWRESVKYSVQYAGGKEEDFVFAIGIDTSYPIKDGFYSGAYLYERYGSNIRQTAVAGIIMALALIGIMVWLTVTAGRSGKDEELHLNAFDRWLTEPAAALVVILWAVPLFLAAISMNDGVTGASVEGAYDYSGGVMPKTVICTAAVTAYTCMMFLIGYLSLVRRIKAKIVWENSVLRRIDEFTVQLMSNLHAVWKAVLIFGVFAAVHWMGFIIGRNALVLFLMLMVELVVFIYMVKQAIGRRRIDIGVEKIAGGEVDYKIPTDGMGEEQRSIAEKINSIGQGLDAALAESIKSERLKTDLITNVSHDIKTPLTSIINYVNLLKQENFEEPRLKRYLEVLDQKSQRLKTLTEDVVEASKVSSGNITLEFMNINLVEMIQQTSGEFEEKFGERNLKEVMSLPEREVVIRVDGRRLWRVLANIYNNAAKYAMEGTRVYADLYTSGNTVIFSLKNVSEQPLNISADELTERFIRGDISRSTEGSGLGLSIAKTLTEMQGGRFELYLDGDLFRVTITFPLALP
ncbi:MAG: HAMP domain-containing histidine kinase, partial [Dorea sp.]|nr:HAMP domain-containing histidine kinase [Dorea sp.]